MTSARCILSIAVVKGWSLHQLDVKNAFQLTLCFVGGWAEEEEERGWGCVDLKEEFYMRQPEGVDGNRNLVCRLKKLTIVRSRAFSWLGREGEPSKKELLHDWRIKKARSFFRNEVQFWDFSTRIQRINGVAKHTAASLIVSVRKGSLNPYESWLILSPPFSPTLLTLYPPQNQTPIYIPSLHVPALSSPLLKTSNRGFSENFERFPVVETSKRVNGSKKFEERIGVVMEDEMEPEVFWEQRVKDVELRKREGLLRVPGLVSLRLDFCSLIILVLLSFSLKRVMLRFNRRQNPVETTPLAGYSAGAIVCAVIASGASMQEALNAKKILAEDCRARGTAFRLGAVLRDVLNNFLPDDAHTRGLLVDQFDSREDLINVVFTSSFIPGYLAPSPATMFRNRVCIDGGLTLFMPPPSASKTVHVCAFPASRLGLEEIGISPACNPENRASPRELFNWALEPAEDEILDKLFELGSLDAAVCAEENPVDKTVEDEAALVENGSAT
ncbi:hypothetical protein Patl1_35541 [Pistacia atlantica]|nr:hypothetical protein Patl1_35541 [Pistacia atlantica]